MNNKDGMLMDFLALFVFLLVFVLLSPFITIWSLNNLFGMSIDFNIRTYMATLWLSALVAGGYVNKK